jgi:hypothetical protein
LTQARDLLRKLDKAGHVKAPPARGPQAGQPRRLASSGQSLPSVEPLPGRANEIEGLYLHLLSGWKDPLSPLWNELIVNSIHSKTLPWWAASCDT